MTYSLPPVMHSQHDSCLRFNPCCTLTPLPNSLPRVLVTDELHSHFTLLPHALSVCLRFTLHHVPHSCVPTSLTDSCLTSVTSPNAPPHLFCTALTACNCLHCKYLCGSHPCPADSLSMAWVSASLWWPSTKWTQPSSCRHALSKLFRPLLRGIAFIESDWVVFHIYE